VRLWLEQAFIELERGIAEIPGPQSSERIDAYLRAAGLGRGDETPWCAAFVCWCLEQAGEASTRRGNAKSYLAWGWPTAPRLGAVSVLWRGAPTGSQGHVGFYLDGDPELVYLLGGNQRDRVSIGAFPRSRVIGHRWPAREGD